MFLRLPRFPTSHGKPRQNKSVALRIDGIDFQQTGGHLSLNSPGTWIFLESLTLKQLTPFFQRPDVTGGQNLGGENREWIQLRQSHRRAITHFFHTPPEKYEKSPFNMDYQKGQGITQHSCIKATWMPSFLFRILLGRPGVVQFHEKEKTCRYVNSPTKHGDLCTHCSH